MSVNFISSQSLGSFSDPSTSQEAPSVWAGIFRLVAAQVSCTEDVAAAYPLNQEIGDGRTTIVRDLLFLIARIGLYVVIGILNYRWQLIM